MDDPHIRHQAQPRTSSKHLPSRPVSGSHLANLSRLSQTCSDFAKHLGKGHEGLSPRQITLLMPGTSGHEERGHINAAAS